jgi:hypothetical protein
MDLNDRGYQRRKAPRFDSIVAHPKISRARICACSFILARNHTSLRTFLFSQTFSNLITVDPLRHVKPRANFPNEIVTLTFKFLERQTSDQYSNLVDFETVRVVIRFQKKLGLRREL